MCLNKLSKYPCGKCYECLSKRRSDWSIRLQEELKDKKVAYHAILTYDDDHIPMSRNGLATLCKKDVQDFIKRLRHKFDNHISYFLAGEYGHKSQRPHYHIIIFGVPKYPDIKSFVNDLYSEKLRSLIEGSWQNGFVRKQSKYVVTDAQLHYITKDIYNWVSPLDLFEHYKKLSNSPKVGKDSKIFSNFIKNTFNGFIQSDCVDDRQQSFRLFSKNLGIGYLDRADKVPDSVVLKYKDTFLPRKQDNKLLHCPSNYVPVGEFFVRRDIYDNFEFNDLNELVIPSDILKFADDRYIKVDLVRDRDGKKKLHRDVFALPRYYRRKLFSYDVSSFFAMKSYFKSVNRISDYIEKYGKYDSEHDLPYYILSANEQWKYFYKSHKDKISDILNSNMSDCQ